MMPGIPGCIPQNRCHGMCLAARRGGGCRGGSGRRCCHSSIKPLECFIPVLPTHGRDRAPRSRHEAGSSGRDRTLPRRLGPCQEGLGLIPCQQLPQPRISPGTIPFPDLPRPPRHGNWKPAGRFSSLVILANVRSLMDHWHWGGWRGVTLKVRRHLDLGSILGWGVATWLLLCLCSERENERDN